MSPGSFWRSPSRGMRVAARACSMAAARAAVCPEFRRKKTTRSHLRSRAAFSRSLGVASVEPSSTSTTS